MLSFCHWLQGKEHLFHLLFPLPEEQIMLIIRSRGYLGRLPLFDYLHSKRQPQLGLNSSFQRQKAQCSLKTRTLHAEAGLGQPGRFLLKSLPCGYKFLVCLIPSLTPGCPLPLWELFALNKPATPCCWTRTCSFQIAVERSSSWTILHIKTFSSGFRHCWNSAYWIAFE